MALHCERMLQEVSDGNVADIIQRFGFAMHYTHV
jgi:hypothetical protein